MSNNKFMRTSILNGSSNSQTGGWSQGYSSQDQFNFSLGSDSSQGLAVAMKKEVGMGIEKLAETFLAVMLPMKSKIEENATIMHIMRQQLKGISDLIVEIKQDIREIKQSGKDSSGLVKNIKSVKSSSLSLTSSLSLPNSRSNSNNINNTNNINSSSNSNNIYKKLVNDDNNTPDIKEFTASSDPAPGTIKIALEARESQPNNSNSISNIISSSKEPPRSPNNTYAEPDNNNNNNNKNNKQDVNELSQSDIEISEYLNHRMKTKDRDRDKKDKELVDNRNLRRKIEMDEDLFN